MSAYDEMVAWYRAMRKKREEEAVATQQEKANSDETTDIVFTCRTPYGHSAVVHWPVDTKKPKVVKMSAGHVEFVAYTGEFPNLCSGGLFLIVNGEKWFFHYYVEGPCMSNGVHVAPSFWKSGGDCVFCGDDYDDDECTTKAPWIINLYEIPSEISLYADEIESLINANIPHGCCGGCL